MKTTAMVLNEYGESAQFIKSEIELPALGANQVVVEVNATSLNPVDNKILRGAPIGPELPSALHGDVAGVVIEVGGKVQAFKSGDQVFGIAGGVTGYGGASANHMVVDEELISHKPKTLSFAHAAALPLVFVTAYEGLVDKANLCRGQNLLVIGGTGGVGHQVVQLGKILGAKVTTVVSSDDQGEIVKSLGADRVINRHKISIENYCEFAAVPDGFDVVFDTIGGLNLDNDWSLVKPNGQVVTTTSMETHDLTPVHMKGISLHLVFMLLPMLTNKDKARHQKVLSFLSQKVDDGKIRPLLDEHQFSLQQLNEAHAFYESGQYRGKIIIDNSEKL